MGLANDQEVSIQILLTILSLDPTEKLPKNRGYENQRKNILIFNQISQPVAK